MAPAKSNFDYAPLKELRDQLEAKLLRDVPEYRQLLALDEVIAKQESPPIPGLASMGLEPPKPTIEGLAAAAVRKAGKPLPISTLFEEIDRVKRFENKRNAKITVVSVLSKGKALQSMRWQGGHAWWLKGERPPPEENVSALL